MGVAMRLLTFLLLLCSSTFASPVVVDINPDVDRKDVLTDNTVSLDVPKNSKSASVTVDGLKITVRANRLDPDWWRGGYDADLSFSNDGVMAEGMLTLQIDGLAPGKHSLATFHNGVREQALGPCTINVEGGDKVIVKPSRRVTHEDDAAVGYLTFRAQAGKPVVVQIAADGADREVILNGLSIDVPDPNLQARKPSPAAGDEHVAENPTLSWEPVKGAKYDVYFGTSPTPELLRQQGETKFTPKNLDPFQTYYWRVDTVIGDTVTPGKLWRFRIRQLAFPGAEGYGRFARGGRGGRVIAVTNLDDSGPGSLREAVEADGPRTIVFRTGGTITLKDRLVIKNPYITVAGQTAPGDGICVRGATFGMMGVNDAIIRYLRIRVGDATGKTFDGTGLGGNTDHAIIDHCSVSWTIDESVSSRSGRNITFQRNLIAEALNMSVHSHYTGSGKGHSFAGSISGNIGSFHHNLVSNCAGRTWSLAGGLNRAGGYAGHLDIRNNVIWNWAHRTNDGGAKAVNIVGNYYIPGPATKVFHLLKPDAGSLQDPQQYFLAGNVMEGRPYDADNWANGGVQVDQDLVSQVKLTKPFCPSYITEHTAKQAYESVIADVGANLPRYDAVDGRTVRDVIARKTSFKGSKTGMPGIIDSQADVGGWPELKPGAAPPDSDGDGMPDAWEAAHKLNPNDPADGNAVTRGDTNLEHYLQWIIDNGGKLVP
jgi:hypothetical protein